MELTDEALQKFVGGRVDSQDKTRNSRRMGEIESVALRGNMLSIRMAWAATNVGWPRNNTGVWEKHANLSCHVDLGAHSVQEDGSRIVITSVPPRDVTILMPPGDKDALPKSRVKGLEA